MLQFQAQVYRIADIIGWNERKELLLSPKFQRRPVWKPRAKSYLMDSVVRGMPLPQFFVRETVSLKDKKTVREVVDGQQRLSAILEFIAGKVTILQIHNKELSGLTYDRLPEEVQRKVLQFPLSVNVLQGVEDSGVLEIFARLNSYSVPLNQQEKLNAKYVGAFKDCMLSLSARHKTYWVANKLLSEQTIARMKDVEFTSELVAEMLFGLQSQKSIILKLYEDFDEGFPQGEYVEKRFDEILGICDGILGGEIAKTEFRRTVLFYSLFGAVYDACYGLKSKGTKSRKLKRGSNLPVVQQELLELSEYVQGRREKEDDIPRGTNAVYENFYQATTYSTDKLPQRKTRHDIILKIVSPYFK